MNRIYGWEPEPYYNVTEIQSHPSMPQSLKDHIGKIWSENCQNLEGNCPQMRMVWLNCQGATDHDQEYLGPIMYMPMQGYPGYYFPFMNQQHYLR